MNPRLQLDREEQLFRRACGEVEEAVRAGAADPVERCLAEHPCLSESPERVVELIFTEYLAREGTELAPAPAEYYRRFPEHRERLERLFQVDDLLHSSGGATLALDSNGERRTESLHQPLEKLRIGPYQVLARLGGGGMGVVFKALHPGLKRMVAVKRLRRGVESDVQAQVRFQREA